MNPTLVTCYVNPDLDGVAGAMAYAEFLSHSGTPAEVGIIGEPHDEALYILDRFSIPRPKSIPNADVYNKVILVDSSDLTGLEGKVAPEKVIEIIDHRKIHEADKFPNAKAQIELVGAAATLVAEKFMETNSPISKSSAILLYGAIISNTLNFKGTVTTDRDRKAAEWLNRVARLPESFWLELFTTKSAMPGAKLEERIRGDFTWFTIKDIKMGIAQIEMIGAENLARERLTDILDILTKLKTEMSLDLVFQTTIELKDSKNVFITNDESAKKLLEKVFGVKFSGDVAIRPGMIMRKQIVPLLKESLEK